MIVVRTEDNQNGQLAVKFFVSFSGSVLDSDTAMTALQVVEELSGGVPTLLRSSKLLFVDARLA